MRTTPASRRAGRRGTAVLVTLLIAVAPSHAARAATAPSGPHLVEGQATFTTQGNRLDINQSSAKAIIDWQSFCIGAGWIVAYHLPNSQAATLNRVTGGSSSLIAGQLVSNGRLLLVNPAGVTVTSTGTIRAASLVLTTANIANADFLAGRGFFAEDLGTPGGMVLNQGTLQVGDGGRVLLAASAVRNEGVIQARAGTVALAAGRGFTLDLDGDGLLSFQITTPVSVLPVDGQGRPVTALASNTGSLIADGGRVLISARAAAQVVDTVINTTGLVRARSAALVDGEVVLDGGAAGNVAVGGSIDASGANPGEHGGTITVLGEGVAVTGASRLDATGQAGGGTIRVGGDLHGGGGLPVSQTASLAATAVLDASATGKGDGGRVVMWSQRSTRAEGTLLVRGGALGGNGGLVEVSGRRGFDFRGIADRSAPHGRAGTLLLDPNNLTIVGDTPAADTNVAGFSTTDDSATVSNSTIQGALAGGNVIIQTASAGGNSEAGDITVNAKVTNPGGNDLTLRASHDILATDNAYLDMGAGGGNLTLSAGNGLTGSGAIGRAPGSVNTTPWIAMGSGALILKAATGIDVATTNLGVVAAQTQSGPISIANRSASTVVVGAAGGLTGLSIVGHGDSVSLSNIGDISVRASIDAVGDGTGSRSVALSGRAVSFDAGAGTVRGDTTLSAGGGLRINTAMVFGGSLDASADSMAFAAPVTVNGDHASLSAANSLDILAGLTANAVSLDGTIIASGLDVGSLSVSGPSAVMTGRVAGQGDAGAASLTNGPQDSAHTMNGVALGIDPLANNSAPSLPGDQPPEAQDQSDPSEQVADASADPVATPKRVRKLAERPSKNGEILPRLLRIGTPAGGRAAGRGAPARHQRYSVLGNIDRW